jgi:hypothetical protein
MLYTYIYIMQINETEPSIDLMTGKRLFGETKASQAAGGAASGGAGAGAGAGTGAADVDDDDDEDEDD